MSVNVYLLLARIVAFVCGVPLQSGGAAVSYVLFVAKGGDSDNFLLAMMPHGLAWWIEWLGILIYHAVR